MLIARVEDQPVYPQTGPTLAVQEAPAKEYEYIVVGSGAGGSPLAVNLARAGHSVLLIDAGGDYGNLRQVDAPAWRTRPLKGMKLPGDSSPIITPTRPKRRRTESSPI